MVAAPQYDKRRMDEIAVILRRYCRKDTENICKRDTGSYLVPFVCSILTELHWGYE